MRSVGIHLKELIGAAAYLNSASDPIPYPRDQELEDWVGWNPTLMRTLRELKDETEDANGRMEKMAVILTAVLRKVKGLEAAEALRGVKEMNFWKDSTESKRNEPSKLMTGDQHLKELQTNEDKEIIKD